MYLATSFALVQCHTKTCYLVHLTQTRIFLTCYLIILYGTSYKFLESTTKTLNILNRLFHLFPIIPQMTLEKIKQYNKAVKLWHIDQ